MGLIIDANKAADFLNHSDQPANRTIYDWIEKSGGKLVFGGRHLREWNKINKASRYFYCLTSID